MPESSPPRFAPRQSVAEVEEGKALTPKFGADGLIPCVVTDADAGDVLMFGFMNAESLALTIETGEAHFWSRSRKSLWKKGETSGRVLTVTELRVDCDQDAIWLKAKAGVDGASCHLGYRSCFFRSVPLKTGAPPQKLALEFKEAAKVFDPKEVYGNQPKADK